MTAIGTLSMFNLLQVALLPSAKEVNDDYATVKKAREGIMHSFLTLDVSTQPKDTTLELDTFIITDHLRKFDEADQSLVMEATLLTSWTDTRLNWEPQDFGNINELAVTGYDINTFWTPPIELKSILPSRKSIMSPYNTELMVQHDGTVLAATKISVKMACDSDLADYPYDTPECSLYLTFRFQHGQNYTFGDNHIFMDRESIMSGNSMTKHAAYEIKNMTATRYYVTGLGVSTEYVKYRRGEVKKATGSFVQYKFQIVRNYGAYVYTVLLPLYCATVFALVGASLMNFYNSMLLLLLSLLYLILTMIKISATLPPNYEITPYCMTYAVFIFVEILFFLGYKVTLALYLKKEVLKAEEASNLQLLDRVFRYYLICHLFLSFFLLFW
ncbi:unnamed protein product [Bursaphelenchus okinawaensis]|uniref:Neurotransmitter-gated ion-channel ligand-binding domain-containing protein n=1 Tax=Bursaphelenchus okinawaensis TaxID=465554 RepID=A0A811KMZ9_9BILA|nr:unnamed protein product [Bursaphelenchus okinawaensis]CAG9106950.1 unnamed protein product [Bursaphelenchus okinawaensis]